MANSPLANEAVDLPPAMLHVQSPGVMAASRQSTLGAGAGAGAGVGAGVGAGAAGRSVQPLESVNARGNARTAKRAIECGRVAFMVPGMESDATLHKPAA